MHLNASERASEIMDKYQYTPKNWGIVGIVK